MIHKYSVLTLHSLLLVSEPFLGLNRSANTNADQKKKKILKIEPIPSYQTNKNKTCQPNEEKKR